MAESLPETLVFRPLTAILMPQTVKHARLPCQSRIQHPTRPHLIRHQQPGAVEHRERTCEGRAAPQRRAGEAFGNGRLGDVQANGRDETLRNGCDALWSLQPPARCSLRRRKNGRLRLCRAAAGQVMSLWMVPGASSQHFGHSPNGCTMSVTLNGHF